MFLIAIGDTIIIILCACSFVVYDVNTNLGVRMIISPSSQVKVKALGLGHEWSYSI